MIKDKQIMKLLKVNQISYTLGMTSLGELRKCLRLNDEDYHYTLDSVELDKEITKELLNIING